MARTRRLLRIGVIGLGHFAQNAILPAFRHLEDVELVALASGSPRKREELGARYEVEHTTSYDELPTLLACGAIDAAYIALPPELHAEYAILCARAGVHVLCETPMAPTEAACRAMIEACAAARVRLMIAYRLHFEAANLTAIQLAQGGALGEPRIFSSVSSQQVREQNIRTQARAGAGPLYDRGLYCINAARYLFRDEPREVQATFFANRGDPRFAHVPEAVSAILRFPGDRTAVFTASFGAHARAHYEVVCTEGVFSLDDAYDYAADIRLQIANGTRPRARTFHKRDQIAAEIEYFVRCVVDGVDPEPSGYEGLADIRIIEAIHRAATDGVAVPIEPVERPRRPDLDQEIRVAPHGPPRLVEVESASL
jgi:glucose-fructose oxidoreductase